MGDSEQQQQQQNPEQQQQQHQAPLVHQAYLCPGLHDKGTRHLVTPQRFSQLFSGTTWIVIPLFQRRYCWQNKQWSQLWKDLFALAPACDATSMGSTVGHAVGKLCLAQLRIDGREITATNGSEVGFEKEGKGMMLVCIDGQQRCTTTLLLLSAIRDAVKTVAIASESDRQAKELLIQRIEEHIFLNREEYLEWSGRGDGLSVGQVLPFSRLVPSFDDRQPFFEAITGRKASSPSFFRDALQFFASCISKELNYAEAMESKSSSSSTSSSSSVHLGCLKSIADRVLYGLSFVRFEMESAKHMQQVYVYMQEGSLLASLQIYNRAPGISLTASDLLRNYVLSYFLSCGFDEQERVYRENWLPLEHLTGSNPTLFDKFVQEYFGNRIALQRQIQQQRKKEREQREKEKKKKREEEGGGKEEEREKKREEEEDSPPDELPDNLLPPIVQAILKMGRKPPELDSIISYYSAIGYLQHIPFKNKNTVREQCDAVIQLLAEMTAEAAEFAKQKEQQQRAKLSGEEEDKFVAPRPKSKLLMNISSAPLSRGLTSSVNPPLNDGNEEEEDDGEEGEAEEEDGGGRRGKKSDLEGMEE